MKLELLIAMLLLVASCAGPPPYAPGSGAGTSPIGENPNNVSRDAYECEREAALSGAGDKAEAFNRCMQARGHGSKP